MGNIVSLEYLEYSYWQRKAFFTLLSTLSVLPTLWLLNKAKLALEKGSNKPKKNLLGAKNSQIIQRIAKLYKNKAQLQ